MENVYMVASEMEHVLVLQPGIAGIYGYMLQINEPVGPVRNAFKETCEKMNKSWRADGQNVVTLMDKKSDPTSFTVEFFGGGVSDVFVLQSAMKIAKEMNVPLVILP